MLTSNWLQMRELPPLIRYFEPTGAVDLGAMKRTCGTFSYPTELYERGFFSFATIFDVAEGFADVGRFRVAHEISTDEFLNDGLRDRRVRRREAGNMVVSMLRQAWNRMCRDRGLLEYSWSKLSGFHIGKDQIEIGKKLPWGRQGDRRSSMLRNSAGGYVWQFGASAVPHLWPYPHFRLKARVLFAEEAANEAGEVIGEKKKQHRLRRRICKGWRNKQWHGRMMAMLELLSGELSYIKLSMGSDVAAIIDATPVQFTLPVTTDLPDELSDEQEEQDESTVLAAATDLEDVA